MLTGEPFSTWTHVRQTWVAGEVVYDSAVDRRPFTGGEEAP